MTWNYHPILPMWLVVVVVLGLLGAVAYGSWILRQRHVPPVWIGRLAVWRVLIVLLALLCLLRPAVRYHRTEKVLPERLILVDTSSSMATEDAPGGISRLAFAIEQSQHPSLQREILDSTRNTWFGFDSQTTHLMPHAVRSVQAGTNAAHIGRAIQDAVDIWRHSDAARSSRGHGVMPRILLFSDGLERGHPDAMNTAESLGIAVDVVLPETVPQPVVPRLELTELHHPVRVLAGSEFRVQAVVRQQGLEGVPLRLVMEMDGTTIDQRDVMFGEGHREQRVQLRARPDFGGVHDYTLRLVSDDALAETPAEDATRHFQILADRVHHEVLMIDMQWRWEFRYLRRVIESDPGFAFSGFLSRGPGAFVQFAEPHRRVQLAGFPRTLSDLHGFDVVILGDVDPALLPSALPDALYRHVVEHGKSLVVIAGPESANWRRHPRLSALLPVEWSPQGATQHEGPVPVRLSSEGRESPFFYAPEGSSSLRRWPRLPPLDQIYAPLRKKPGATVLMETPAFQNAYGPLIVAAVHPVGRGQVLYLGTDTLWKWQMQGLVDEEGNTPYRVFWQQALRALRPSSAQAAAVAFSLQADRSQVSPGNTVDVYARLHAQHGVSRYRLTGEVTRPDGTTTPVIFHRDPHGPERFRATLAMKQIGLHEVKAWVRSQDDGPRLGEASVVIRTERPSALRESANPAVSYLERLAAVSGGRVLDPTQIVPSPSTTDSTTEATAEQQREVMFDFWANLSLITLLTLALGIDWLIRLMRGYA